MSELHISAELVGARLAGLEREVTWRDTTNYAAAVGDANPLFLDDTTADALQAPPLFAVAVTWPMVANIHEQLGDVFDPRLMLRLVHAAEHLVFHRPVRPGDKLTLTGQVAAVLPSEKGARCVIRIDAHDRQGEPVFTEFTSAFFRGVSCPDGPRGKENLPANPTFAEADSPLWKVALPIAREASFIYDGCTDIVFAIHTSRGFATGVGLPDILLQGTATLAMAAREVLNREAGAQPTRLREIACRFTGMVIPGGTIRVRLTGRRVEGDETLVGFDVLTDDGRAALKGFAKIL